ncbi:MAG TPA: branched-chain amino acid transport, partial [Pseudomonas sp.]|nr:branched-chain amino acid transport [Pseudomonas sp.]
DGQWALSWGNAYLLAGLLAIAIGAVSRNLVATIDGGLLSFLALRWALGQLPI